MSVLWEEKEFIMLFVIETKAEKKPEASAPCYELFGIKIGF